MKNATNNMVAPSLEMLTWRKVCKFAEQRKMTVEDAAIFLVKKVTQTRDAAIKNFTRGVTQTRIVRSVA